MCEWVCACGCTGRVWGAPKWAQLGIRRQEPPPPHFTSLQNLYKDFNAQIDSFNAFGTAGKYVKMWNKLQGMLGEGGDVQASMGQVQEQLAGADAMVKAAVQYSGGYSGTPPPAGG